MGRCCPRADCQSGWDVLRVLCWLRFPSFLSQVSELQRSLRADSRISPLSPWDRLEPGTLCCSALMLAPGQMSLQAKCTKKLQGSKKKKTARHKFWTASYKKTKNPTATSEELGAAHVLCTQHHQRSWAKHLSHPSGPTLWHTSTLAPYKEPDPPSLLREQASKGSCCLFSLPSAAVEAPIKPCLISLSGLLSVSID